MILKGIRYPSPHSAHYYNNTVIYASKLLRVLVTYSIALGRLEHVNVTIQRPHHCSTSNDGKEETKFL